MDCFTVAIKSGQLTASLLSGIPLTASILSGWTASHSIDFNMY